MNDAMTYEKGRPFFGVSRKLQRDPLTFLGEISRRSAGVVALRLGLETVYLLNRAEHIHRVFVENRRNYVKSAYYRRIRPLLGDGLFTLDGPAWRAQRTVAQPAFRGPCLKGIASRMGQAVEEGRAELIRAARRNEIIDLSPFTARVALDISMRCLFSKTINRHTSVQIYQSLSTILECIERRIWSALPAPVWAPTPNSTRLRGALGRLDAIVYAMIEERMRTGSKGDDLLDRLLVAEASADCRDTISKRVRDQVTSILLAAHETTALSLAWALLEISKRSDVEERLAEEAASAGLSGPIDFETLGRLRYAECVFKEALRLYPPAWCYSRKALESDRMAAASIPASSTVMLCPYIIQRKAEYWSRPDAFEPERFAGGDENPPVPGSYFPFAGGNHMCLGNRFAMMEGKLMLSMLLKDVTFEIKNAGQISPMPATTLRTSTPVLALARLRRSTLKTAA